jgi:hypothetical protein
MTVSDYANVVIATLMAMTFAGALVGGYINMVRKLDKANVGIEDIQHKQMVLDIEVNALNQRMLKCEFALGLVKVSAEEVHSQIHNKPE